MSPVATSITYEVVSDALTLGNYRVEAIDSDSDGEIYVAIFSGPGAQERAEEYAAWKNNS